jgi:hypothetical protein
MLGYRTCVIDLGTGDGRFLRHLTEAHPGTFGIGVGACRENLRAASRREGANALFVIANTHCLPTELAGLAARVTINFPWGSLLADLLAADPAFMQGLSAISLPGARLEVCLNAAALAETGRSLEQGALQIQSNLRAHGFCLRPPARLDTHSLRAYPTTWARRLAFGRDPRAVVITGMKTSVGLETKRPAPAGGLSYRRR